MRKVYSLNGAFHMILLKWFYLIICEMKDVFRALLSAFKKTVPFE